MRWRAFEAWDPAGRTFDAVIAGQAWHWVDPVRRRGQGRRGAEAPWPAGRVLERVPAPGRPGGRLRRHLPPRAAGLADLRGTSGGLAAYSGQFAKAADGIRAVGGFGVPEQWSFDWERSYTREEWLDLVPTSGGHSQFPPGQLEELLAGLGDAIDAVGGTFTMDYTAVAVTAVACRCRLTGTRERPRPNGCSLVSADVLLHQIRHL